MRSTAQDTGDFTRKIFGRVSSAGVLLSSNEPVLIIRNGTGSYSVWLRKASRRVISCEAVSEAASFIFASAGVANQVGSIVVNTWISTSGSLTDAQFSFSMMVSDR